MGRVSLHPNDKEGLRETFDAVKWDCDGDIISVSDDGSCQPPSDDKEGLRDTFGESVGDPETGVTSDVDASLHRM